MVNTLVHILKSLQQDFKNIHKLKCHQTYIGLLTLSAFERNALKLILLKRNGLNQKFYSKLKSPKTKAVKIVCKGLV